jgi:hypothetical protein
VTANDGTFEIIGDGVGSPFAICLSFARSSFDDVTDASVAVCATATGGEAQVNAT